MRCSYGTKHDDTVAEVSNATLVVIYDCYLPSAVELKFVGMTISAADDGTYNLSVEITHGTGKQLLNPAVSMCAWGD